MRNTLYTILSAIQPNVFPGDVPQEIKPPFISYHISNTDPTNTKSGTSEIDFPQLVLDIYAITLSEALTLAESVRVVLDYYSNSTITRIVFKGQSDDFSFDSEYSMIRQEYTIRLKR
jgi:hypothetical protein